MTTTALAVRDNDISLYMAEVNRHPLLSRDEEQSLARRFRDQEDVTAAHQLVVSNLRFVVKIAHEYRNYGLKLADLVQEGNMGLMIAVKKFDPDRGYRLITYAVWWIRAQIQDYIMRSWSLVKLSTSKLKRKLFFKLRSTRAAAEQYAAARGEDAADSNHTRALVAESLGVNESDVIDMEGRLAARDFSLDGALRHDADAGTATHLEMLADEHDNQESSLGEAEEQHLVRREVQQALAKLNEKERYIVEHRLLADEPQTLQDIGDHFGVSRERIRQLEKRVLHGLRGRLASLVAPPAQAAAA